VPCLADSLGLFYIDRLPGFIIVCEIHQGAHQPFELLFKQPFVNERAILAERFGSRYGFAAKGLGQTAQGCFSTLYRAGPAKTS
jgi:hypothetical protein